MIVWTGGARTCKGALRHNGIAYDDFTPEEEASLLEQGKAHRAVANPKTFVDREAIPMSARGED